MDLFLLVYLMLNQLSLGLDMTQHNDLFNSLKLLLILRYYGVNVTYSIVISTIDMFRILMVVISTFSI